MLGTASIISTQHPAVITDFQAHPSSHPTSPQYMPPEIMRPQYSQVLPIKTHHHHRNCAPKECRTSNRNNRRNTTPALSCTTSSHNSVQPRSHLPNARHLLVEHHPNRCHDPPTSTLSLPHLQSMPLTVLHITNLGHLPSPPTGHNDRASTRIRV